MDNSEECNRLRRLCKEHRGPTYPPRCVSNMFEHLREDLHIGSSDIVGAGEGLFTGTPLVKGQIVGVYEGVEIDEAEGDYVLEIAEGRRGLRWVNADPARTDRVSIFRKMNEDLREGRYNAEIREDRFIKILTDCNAEELFTRYGPKYNWDSQKHKALQGLVEETDRLFPSMRGKILRDWGAIKESSCALQVWVRKLIEGKSANNEMHGVRCYDEQDT